MAISGHRTRSVFDRYNIVEEDVKAAGEAVESYLERSTQDTHSQVTRIGQGSGTDRQVTGTIGQNRPQLRLCPLGANSLKQLVPEGGLEPPRGVNLARF